MKLLFDENLPPSAARIVAIEFPGSMHVNRLALARAQDRILFRYAAENGFTIVTRDSDFRQLSLSLGAPPKIIMINVENAAVAQVGKLILDNAADIQAFIAADTPSLIGIGPTTQQRS